MMLSTLIWGSPEWLPWAALIFILGILLLAWCYGRSRLNRRSQMQGFGLKTTAIALLLLCLLEPLFSGSRPRPGANDFLVLVDNSQSLTIRRSTDSEMRADELSPVLADDSNWVKRLAQDFRVRRYRFDTRLEPVETFEHLEFDGSGTSLSTSLAALNRRFRDRPVAGILLFTDGNLTDGDLDEVQWEGMPPIYPVALNSELRVRDLSLEQVSVRESNFETAPISISANVRADQMEDSGIVVELLDEDEEIVQKQVLTEVDQEHGTAVRFEVRPETAGVSFYSLAVRSSSKEAGKESTLLNNRHLLSVDRGGGPYRILYVGGRPNWEFKFLRRAAQGDEEVDIVGLLRVARKEPKFEFRSRRGEQTNPLFRGFDAGSDDTNEDYSEPVLIRLGTRDAAELQKGFPSRDEDLFSYDAIILDDVEAAFFTEDQKLLIRKFVAQRGGGFLMLGGAESFSQGGYARSPIEEMLPVYSERNPDSVTSSRFRFQLTAEGWIEPWMRLRSSEEADRKRIGGMPGFDTLNRIRGIKPGATVLAQGVSPTAEKVPALVAQRFGLGRTAALLIGDLWRWELEREPAGPRDLEQAWRQILRWLVSDVPRQVQVELQDAQDGDAASMQIRVEVRDETFTPLDNAEVRVTIEDPEGERLEISAEPSDSAGIYRSTYVARSEGVYRATVEALGPDGSVVGEHEAGWVYQPSAREFASLSLNDGILDEIARRSGGERVILDDLEEFVADLNQREVPIVEPWIYPVWHHWGMLSIIVLCLTGEWALRRIRGLP